MESKLKWLKYPENVPDGDGYYLTVHVVDGKEYMKSIWWNSKIWVKWRVNLGYELNVKEFAPETKAPFYTESLRIAREIEHG